MMQFRYFPLTDTYFKFISELEAERKSLFYHISDDSLILYVDGKYEEHDSEILKDETWD